MNGDFRPRHLQILRKKELISHFCHEIEMNRVSLNILLQYYCSLTLDIIHKAPSKSKQRKRAAGTFLDKQNQLQFNDVHGFSELINIS